VTIVAVLPDMVIDPTVGVLIVPRIGTDVLPDTVSVVDAGVILLSFRILAELPDVDIAPDAGVINVATSRVAAMPLNSMEAVLGTFCSPSSDDRIIKLNHYSLQSVKYYYITPT